MKTVVFITAFCCILYKSGTIKKLLTACKVDPEPIPATTQPEPGKMTPYQEQQKERKQLESDAIYILTKQGYKYPETVRYMGTEMLINIIREYLDV